MLYQYIALRFPHCFGGGIPPISYLIEAHNDAHAWWIAQNGDFIKDSSCAGESELGKDWTLASQDQVFSDLRESGWISLPDTRNHSGDWHLFRKKEGPIYEEDVQWIVNSSGELGVLIHTGEGPVAFFCYKGEALRYSDPIVVRRVGKREFGETPRRGLLISETESALKVQEEVDGRLNLGEWKKLR